MASPGQPFNQTVVVDSSPEEVIQRLLGSTAGTRDYTFNMAGPNSLVVTRKYIPQWAVIVAIIGVFLFLIGLLALLYKETEVLTVTAAEGPEGTKITMNGMATAELVSRLNAVFQADQASRQTRSDLPIAAKAASTVVVVTASVTCPNGHPMTTGDGFCGECGMPAPVTCENGHPLDRSKRFCSECGAPASAGRPEQSQTPTKRTAAGKLPTKRSPAKPPGKSSVTPKPDSNAKPKSD